MGGEQGQCRALAARGHLVRLVGPGVAAAVEVALDPPVGRAGDLQQALLVRKAQAVPLRLDLAVEAAEHLVVGTLVEPQQVGRVRPRGVAHGVRRVLRPAHLGQVDRVLGVGAADAVAVLAVEVGDAREQQQRPALALGQSRRVAHQRPAVTLPAHLLGGDHPAHAAGQDARRAVAQVAQLQVVAADQRAVLERGAAGPVGSMGRAGRRASLTGGGQALFDVDVRVELAQHQRFARVPLGVGLRRADLGGLARRSSFGLSHARRSRPGGRSPPTRRRPR